MMSWRGVWRDRCLFGVTKLREYKKQLAKAKGLIADGVTDEINLMKQLTKAQEQLAASQAEVERLDKANDELVLLLLRKHDPEGYKDFMKEYKYKEQGQWERQND